MILGRFNYLTIRKDRYSVIFSHRSGSLITVIASNLSRDDAIEIMDGLNSQLLGEEEDVEEEKNNSK